MMRLLPVSTCFLFAVFVVAALFLSSCGEEDQNAEQQQAQEVGGPLLTKGDVPAINMGGAQVVAEIIQDMFDTEQYAQLHSQLIEAIEDNLEERGIFLEVDELVKKYMSQEGVFLVTPRPEHYEVTIPQATSILLPEEGEVITDFQDPENRRLIITHNISLNVVPTGDPSAWRVELKFPDQSFKIGIQEGDEYTELSTLTFETEGVTGLWHTQARNFLQIETLIQDIRLRLLAVKARNYKDNYDIETYEMRVGFLKLAGALEPDVNNLWSGKLQTILREISTLFPPRMGKYSLYEINLQQNIDQLNPVVYETFYEDYHAFMEDLHRAQGQDDGADPDALEEKGIDMMSHYKTLISDGFSAFDLAGQLKILNIAFPNKVDDHGQQESFSIDQIDFNTSLKDVKSDRATAGVGYALQGIAFHSDMIGKQNMPFELPDEVYPENLKFSISAESLPLLSLFDLGLQQAKAMQSKDVDPQAVLNDTALRQKSIALLSEADTKVKLADNYVGNDVWLLLMNGGGDINAAAAYNVTGEAELQFYGMDSLIQNLTSRADIEDNIRMQETLRTMIASLSFVQAFGQLKTNDEGNSYRGYTFTITEDGQIQMNGTDIQQMINIAR